MESKHTKGEYVISDQGGDGIYVKINEPHADAILRIYTDNSTVKSTEEALANAERIVKSVNNHDELILRLNNICEEWERQKKLFPEITKDGWMQSKIHLAKLFIDKIT